MSIETGLIGSWQLSADGVMPRDEITMPSCATR